MSRCQTHPGACALLRCLLMVLAFVLTGGQPLQAQKPSPEPGAEWPQTPAITLSPSGLRFTGTDASALQCAAILREASTALYRQGFLSAARNRYHHKLSLAMLDHVTTHLPQRRAALRAHSLALRQSLSRSALYREFRVTLHSCQSRFLH